MELLLNYVYVGIAVVGVLFFLRKSANITEAAKAIEAKVIELAGGKEKLNLIKDTVLEAIAGVEQLSKSEGMTSEQKEELAIALVQDLLDIAGIEQINSETIRMLIRAEGFLSGIFGKKDEKKQ